MNDNDFVYDDGIEVFYFNGEAGGGGKSWKRVDIEKDMAPLAVLGGEWRHPDPKLVLYKIFDLMLKGRTVMLMRKLHDGSYVSVDTNGKDLQMNWLEWMKEYRPEQFAKLNSNDIEP